MEFTDSDISVYHEVQTDDNIQVDERLFKKISVAESEAVWSDYNLAGVDERVQEFETAYKEMDASGIYQITNEDGSLKVIAHSLAQYPIDPAMTDEEEPGHIPESEWDELNEQLIEAQEEVAQRITDRLDEFVGR